MKPSNSNASYCIEIDAKKSWRLNLKEIYDYLGLLYFFCWRNIKVKYKQTMLGVVWAIFQPLVMVAVFTVFVKGALKIETSQIPYPIFAYSGYMLWTAFSSSMVNAGGSMVLNFHIIQKVYFPRILIPLSTILASVFDFCISFVVFIILLLFMQYPINLMQVVLCWPAGLLLTLIGATGPGLLIAALNVKYRDFQYALPFFIQMAFFVTPVIYPLSIIKNEWIKYILALNPMHAAISIFRLPFVDSLPLDPMLVLISIFSGIIFLFIGTTYFRYAESYFADLI